MKMVYTHDFDQLNKEGIMSSLRGLSGQHLSAFGTNASRFKFFGIALIILGLLAIVGAEFTTLLSVMVLGFIIFLGGAIIAFDTFSFWWGKWSGFFLHLVVAVLYLFAGIYLIRNPILSSITLTYMLGFIYVALGVFRILLTPAVRSPRWGWGFFNGIITLILGILIILSLPSSALWIIGTFIGIDLVFTGLNYVMAASAAQKLAG